MKTHTHTHMYTQWCNDLPNSAKQNSKQKTSTSHKEWCCRKWRANRKLAWNTIASTRTLVAKSAQTNLSLKPSKAKWLTDSDAVYPVRLDFQKTAEEGVWIGTGGKIMGKTKKSVLYVGSCHWPCAERGTVLMKYCVGDQMEEPEKCIQGFGKKTWGKGITQKTYTYVEW